MKPLNSIGFEENFNGQKFSRHNNVYFYIITCVLCMLYSSNMYVY